MNSVAERLEQVFRNGKFDSSIDEHEKALIAVVRAAEEHIDCEPGMYANECVGLGGADDLKQALASLRAVLEAK